MERWNPEQYMKFGEQRTRAASDLVARVQLNSPAFIVDLGCGSGNSTKVIRERWPEAEVVGIDRSAEMIAAARQQEPNQEWIVADANDWELVPPCDLLYANATLHWLPDHDVAVPNLFQRVNESGAFAFQIPSSRFPEVRQHIHQLSTDPRWDDRMNEAREQLTMKPPAFYYDLLAAEASALDLWETEYFQRDDFASGDCRMDCQYGIAAILGAA